MIQLSKDSYSSNIGAASLNPPSSDREDPPRGGHARGLDRAVERRDGRVEADPSAVAPYVTDNDSTYERELKAGATSLREPMDPFTETGAPA